jgi:hypothetical protein
MSLSMIVQGFGWLAVLWLVTVHLLIHQGRLHRGGAAPRVAGAVAALVIVVASLLSEMWPVFVLGLLWLRSELWHRHSPDEAWFPVPDEQPHVAQSPVTPSQHEQAHEQSPVDEPSEAPRGALPDTHPQTHPHHHQGPPADRNPAVLAGGGGTATKPRTSVPAPRTRPGGKSQRHPLLSRHLVDVLFRIEMALLITVTVAAFAFWAYQERPGFSQRANKSVCSFMINRC